ncbi:hypothetical protein UACE39S_03501 [Ureibacillus acetophenoni]
MISLEKKQKVLISFHQENKSQRQIARELGISVPVKKYIDEDLEKENKIFENYLLQITM